jgi:hypothetical protein
MSAASRQKARRDRIRRNAAVFPVEADQHAVAAALIGMGLLREEDCEDRGEVGRALSTLVARWSDAVLEDLSNA